MRAGMDWEFRLGRGNEGCRWRGGGCWRNILYKVLVLKRRWILNMDSDCLS